MSEETVFIAKPGDQAVAAQRDKVASLLDRGVMVAAAVTLIMLVFAIVNTLFSGWSLVVWLYPVGFAVLAVGMYFLIGWVEARPTGAIEVPIHLADELEDAITLTVRLREETLTELDPEDYTDLLKDADRALQEAMDAVQHIVNADGTDDKKAISGNERIFHTKIKIIHELAEEFLGSDIDDNEFGALYGEELPAEFYDEQDIPEKLPQKKGAKKRGKEQKKQRPKERKQISTKKNKKSAR